jgi:hypothetical protein
MEKESRRGEGGENKGQTGIELRIEEGYREG